MADTQKKTLIFGASNKPQRYSYKALVMLQEYKHPIVAIGGHKSTVENVQIDTGHPALEQVHTVTMYMGEDRQKEHEDYLLGLKPKRIIFNPGAENIRLYVRAKEAGIEVINACTLVMLRTDQY